MDHFGSFWEMAFHSSREIRLTTNAIQPRFWLPKIRLTQPLAICRTERGAHLWGPVPSITCLGGLCHHHRGGAVSLAFLGLPLDAVRLTGLWFLVMPQSGSIMWYIYIYIYIMCIHVLSIFCHILYLCWYLGAFSSFSFFLAAKMENRPPSRSCPWVYAKLICRRVRQNLKRKLRVLNILGYNLGGMQP